MLASPCADRHATDTPRTQDALSGYLVPNLYYFEQFQGFNGPSGALFRAFLGPGLGKPRMKHLGATYTP